MLQNPGETVLRGRVVDQRGRPIEGAGCTVGPYDTTLVEDALARPVARSDAAGYLVVRLPKRDAAPGSHQEPMQLLLAAPGKAAVACDHDLMTARAAGGLAELGNVILLDGMTLHGRVRGEDGRPIGGALVEATTIQRRILRTPDDHGRFRPSSQTRSDASGIIHLQCCDLSALSVTVAKEGYFHSLVTPVGAETPLNVNLVCSGFVSGRLLDSDGKPLQSDLWMRSTTASETIRIHSAADGTFRTGLPWPDPYRFVIPGELPGRVLPSETFIGVHNDLVLRTLRPRKVATLSAVAADTKKPIAKLEAGVIWGAASMNNPVFSATYLREREQMRESHEGKVDLYSWQPDQQSGAIVVESRGFAPTLVALPDSGEGEKVAVLEVEMVPGAALTGRVVDAETGSGILGARVWSMFLPSNSSLSYGTPPPGTVSAEDGTFRLQGLGVGQHIVQAVDDQRPIPGGVSALVSREGCAESLLIKIHPSRALRGKLVGAPIDPLWYVEVDADKKSGSLPPGVASWHGRGEAQRAEIAADGTFCVSRLPPGDHAVEIVCAGYGPAQPHRWMLPRVRLGADDKVQEQVHEFDVSCCCTGKIRGSFAAARGHAERVVVIAMPHVGRRDSLIRAASLSGVVTTFLERDGTFVLEATPGDYDLAAGDVATGRILAAVEEPVQVTLGQPVRCEISTTLGVVTVRLPRREAGKDTKGSRGYLVVGADSGGRLTNPRPIEIVAQSVMHRPRVVLDPFQRELVILSAPGLLQLKLGSEPERTIEVVAGKQEVVLDAR